jgi:hypothetical protein
MINALKTALRQLYGSESIEDILAGIIDRRKRFNRLELQSKVTVSAEEHHENRVPEAAIQARRLQFGEIKSANSHNSRQKRDSQKPPANLTVLCQIGFGGLFLT